MGSADLMAHAALANFRGFWSTSGSVDDERIAELESRPEKRSAPTDGPATARILATTSVELLLAADDDQGRLAMADGALGDGSEARRARDARLRVTERGTSCTGFSGSSCNGATVVARAPNVLAEELSDPVEQFLGGQRTTSLCPRTR